MSPFRTRPGGHQRHKRSLKDEQASFDSVCFRLRSQGQTLGQTWIQEHHPQNQCTKIQRTDETKEELSGTSVPRLNSNFFQTWWW